MKKYIWVLLAVLTVVWEWKNSQSVAIKTPAGEICIPKRDKKRLEYLFKELVVYHSAGYTLLGHKPISFDCFFRPTFDWSFLHLWHTFFPSNLKKYQAWKTWQKYAHLFNQGNILIWSEPSPWIENGQLIVIANKREVDRVLRENITDFSSMQNLELKTLFKESLQKHDGFLGTLLGYGRENAWLFYQREHNLLKPVFSEELHQLFESKNASLHYSFAWPDVNMSEILMYPSFMADMTSSETQRLKTEYLQNRQQIIDFYEGKDFLEATFSLINL